MGITGDISKTARVMRPVQRAYDGTTPYPVAAPEPPMNNARLKMKLN
jgi:hypothetical protein